jgi:flagella basal body P-ring formation protein FlgA
MNHATTNRWLLPGVLLAVTLLPSASVWSSAAWQSHDSIREAAEDAVRRAIPGPAELTADSPDPRLRLADCDRPLTAVAPANGVRSPRLTAEVRCEGAQPWRLYLPVRVASTRPVVVTSRALARDTVLAPGDVRLANLASRAAQTGTLADPADAIGRRLRRPADEGQAVTTALITAPTLVRRGQQVSVEAQAGNLKVRMAGTALKDGALGDIIDVESATSGRTVQAVVRSAKSVEVLLR